MSIEEERKKERREREQKSVITKEDKKWVKTMASLASTEAAWTNNNCTAHKYHGTAGTKEGLNSIGRFRSYCQIWGILFILLGKTSLIRYNKHLKVQYYQNNVCKYLKDQDNLIFISKISLGRLKMVVPGVRKINAILQPW